ncbi:GtrA family protein [Companilactobacillus bobalius]|uniref:Cellwall teichoic acid glycosylation protein n=2 Tax=Companilactobacillus bobalius TaxID=2801451 RepID=A0A0R1KGH9_9LACO|nr:GtrA family protein [Companilactobacillus bobalius]KAE9561662.1 teichoic acid glycosylation protein [Companilactobacillus bobalius]KRK82575.1 cellwall teichoic acid glycosylation protein [Companilactobacillus bobalius DSM 19674]OVE98280.1 putative membrane protein YwcD [Companilactobacillus bobalius]GEO58842.1 teichoic acid glycosylation protein [Companilactobacillus paralimentarius]
MDFLKKYRNFGVYCLFGFLASLLNIGIFDLSHNYFHITLWIANTIAWFISNFFSFFVTKLYVFKSEMENLKKLFKEGMFFLVSRIFSLIFDDIFMVVAVFIFPWNNLIIKAIDQLIVGLFNYFSSKLIFNYQNRHLIDRIKNLKARRKSRNEI